MGTLKMEIPETHESAMHFIVEALLSQFRESGAVNYLEQSFQHKDDDESFTLTMQMKNGLTPCEKLQAAEDRIKELEDMLCALLNNKELDVFEMTTEIEELLNKEQK